MKHGSNSDLLELQNSLKFIEKDFTPSKAFLCTNTFRGVPKHAGFCYGDYGNNNSLTAIITHSKKVYGLPTYRMDDFQKSIIKPLKFPYIAEDNYNLSPSYLNMSLVQKDCISFNKLESIFYRTGLNTENNDFVLNSFYKFYHISNIQKIIDTKIALTLVQSFNKKSIINLYDYNSMTELLGEENYLNNFGFYNKYVYLQDKDMVNIALSNYLKITTSFDIAHIDLQGLRESDYLKYLICSLQDL